MSEAELKDVYAEIMAGRSGAPRDACASPEELQGIAEGTASSAERLRIMEHVAGCPPCQRELALLGTVAGTAAGARRAVPRRWLLLAASIAVVAFGVRVARDGGAGQGDAGVMRGEEASVTLVAPVSRAQAAGSLVWRAFPGATRYEVEILDEAGTAVHAGSVRDTVLVLPDDLALAEGSTFRWRVTALRTDGSRAESRLAEFVAASR